MEKLYFVSQPHLGLRKLYYLHDRGHKIRPYIRVLRSDLCSFGDESDSFGDLVFSAQLQAQIIVRHCKHLPVFDVFRIEAQCFFQRGHGFGKVVSREQIAPLEKRIFRFRWVRRLAQRGRGVHDKKEQTQGDGPPQGKSVRGF